MRRAESTTCLSDDELDELTRSPGQDFFASLDPHLTTCASCRELVTKLKQGDVAPSRPPRARAAGERFGRYVILDVLGAGAMGMVYAAHDPYLDRKIAIKVLKPRAGDASLDARARMVKEARAIARLAHPNVIHIYDVGFEAEDMFLAMEFIDGQTLGQWLAAGVRSWRDVIGVYVQAARGLAAAHRAGVVHRDFKPANVFVGKDGRVCVGDFGLASVAGAAPSEVSGETLPVEVAQTVTGAVLGTPAYMSPEQFRGARLDARSDQFSFAVALYEALHGRRPFEGKSWAEVKERIRSGQFAGASDTRVPAHIRHVLRRALAPDAADRYPSMDALIAALEPGRRRTAWIAGALVVGGASAAIVSLRTKPATFEPSVSATRRITFDPGCEELPSFFPDSKTIAYDGIVDGDVEILTLDLDTGERRRLTHAPGWDFAPAVAPDGRHIVYKHMDDAAREARVIGPAGDAEPPISLGRVRGMPAWTRDGRALLAGLNGEVFAVSPAAGAKREQIGAVPSGALALMFAAPRGGTIVVTWDQANHIELGELVGGAPVVRDDKLPELQHAVAASPSLDGYYYTRPGTTGNILAWRPAGEGQTQPVPGGISPSLGLTVSPDGKRMVWSTCRQATFIARVGGAAPTEPLSRGDWEDLYPRRLDAGHILFESQRSGRIQLYSYDLASKQVRPLASQGSHSGSVAGDSLVYADEDHGSGIWTAPLAGGAARQLTKQAGDDWPVVASDGESVVFQRNDAAQGYRIFVVKPGAEPRPLSPAGLWPTVSPIDDTVVYVDREGGGSRVMRTNLAGAPPRPVDGLAIGDWRSPRISADGKRLLVVHKKAEILEVPLDGSAPPAVRWTSTSDALLAADYAPDGDGFIAEIASFDGDLWLAEGRFP